MVMGRDAYDMVVLCSSQCDRMWGGGNTRDSDMALSRCIDPGEL